jgi:TRAP-type C4-dicarboxylate transport system permease large subunit
MDQNPAILILAPVFAPIAANLGIEPIHFGVIVIMNLVIGLITPPLGQVLFVVGPIARVSFEDVAKEVFPFMLAEIGVLLLISYVPYLVVIMPKLFGYIH